jgi:mono/diheme cytochrome c family protein
MARESADAKRLDAAFTRVRKANPKITATTGERIFVALNCAGCHEHPTITPWLNAPDLAAEGSRVRPEWLRAFLARPHAVRPFGTVPGTGGRMPDFRLTPSEVDSLAAYLESRRVALPTFTPRALSAFAQREAESLLRESQPCLGCHQLGGEGGRIAPDLSAAADRLQPAYIQAMIRDPRHTAPWTIMPRVAMPERTAELIASYLAQYRGARGETRYLSLVDTPPVTLSVGGSGAALYQRICAHCHGAGGQGDGWNARYLPVRPTAHSDATYMATRTDDTIYDGIAVGGDILGRSNRMPGFGNMLSPAEIRSLVTYIRELCRCTGPAWSRDGRRSGAR